jgi:pimeloyl-ACP methyl ester carboxylesterase
LLFLFLSVGCGKFAAHRMVQSPNTYPKWFAPEARVTLGFSSNFLTNFPAHRIDLPGPPARMFYRLIEPQNLNFSTTSTNWLKGGKKQYRFKFHARAPGETNQWSSNPRGTIILLHGYGVSQFAMAPWALELADEGWRCVLVDLRGHGKSTGKRIGFGVQESQDLSALLDQLARDGQLQTPVHVIGQSYGAALALRWRGLDDRLDKVVAIAPYAGLSNAVLNIGRDYAKWVPKSFLKAGLRELPEVLGLPREELDTGAVLQRRPVVAFFIAGKDDLVTPPTEIRRLFEIAAPGSEFLLVPDATHEALTYFFDDLTAPIREWLSTKKKK